MQRYDQCIVRVQVENALCLTLNGVANLPIPFVGGGMMPGWHVDCGDALRLVGVYPSQ